MNGRVEQSLAAWALLTIVSAITLSPVGLNTRYWVCLLVLSAFNAAVVLILHVLRKADMEFTKKDLVAQLAQDAPPEAAKYLAGVWQKM